MNADRFISLAKESNPYETGTRRISLGPIRRNLIRHALMESQSADGSFACKMKAAADLARHPGSLLAFCVCADRTMVDVLCRWSTWWYWHHIGFPLDLQEEFGLLTVEGAVHFFGLLNPEWTKVYKDFVVSVDVRMIYVIFKVADQIREALGVFPDCSSADKEIGRLWPQIKALGDAALAE